MKGPQWTYKRRLPIQDHMSGLIRQTIKAAEQELEETRRKLRKVQLGS